MLKLIEKMFFTFPPNNLYYQKEESGHICPQDSVALIQCFFKISFLITSRLTIPIQHQINFFHPSWQQIHQSFNCRHCTASAQALFFCSSCLSNFSSLRAAQRSIHICGTHQEVGDSYRGCHLWTLPRLLVLQLHCCILCRVALITLFLNYVPDQFPHSRCSSDFVQNSSTCFCL